MDQYLPQQHTFVICAYKESPYLEECICSLHNQSVRSRVIMTTATPCAFLDRICEKYGIPLFINPDGGEISKDWNYGMKCANTKLVTIAHQDDIYEPDYLKTVLENFQRAEKPLIAFTDYGELRNGKKTEHTHLLRTKEMMLYLLRYRVFWKSRFIRRRILSLGSAICCPSVTYVKDNLSDTIFMEGYRSDLDWQAWERISARKGSFVYCPSILMYHRIHEESATTRILGDHDRTKEDYEMFCCFWPKCVARILIHFYKNAQNSNQL